MQKSHSKPHHSSWLDIAYSLQYDAHYEYLIIYEPYHGHENNLATW